MVLLDRVLDHEPGEFIEAVLSVSGNLDCIAGHFPERAIYPGSHLIQAFAQCGIILHRVSTRPLEKDELTVILGASSRFFRVVVPGDRVVLRAAVERRMEDTFFFTGDARVDNTRVAAFRTSLTRVHEEKLESPLW